MLDLCLTYLVSVLAALIVAVYPEARPAAERWWQILLVVLIAADLAGGVVANFTVSTDRYYGARPRLRVGFIALHVAQPAILYAAVGGSVAAWAALVVYTLVSSLLVNALRPGAQQPAAAALTAAGLFAFLSFEPLRLPLPWIAPVYLVKLVLGFAVRRSRGAETDE